MSHDNQPYGKLAHEVGVEIGQAEKEVAQTNNRECLIPIDTNLTLCGEPTSNSHSIQRAVIRDCLSRPNRNRVLNFLPRATGVYDALYEQLKITGSVLPIQKVAVDDETEYWQPRLINITDASANPFACGSDYRNHDLETFKAIERGEVDFDSPYHLFLFDYRCVLYALEEMYNARNFHDSIGPSGMIPRYYPQIRQERFWWMRYGDRLTEIKTEATRFREVIPKVDDFKQSLDAMLIGKDYSKLDHKVVDLSVPISMASAAFDSDSGAMVTVYPTNNAGDHKVVVSWHKEELNSELERSISEIIQSVVSPGERGKVSFLEKILGESYNVYTSPDYFQVIPKDLQERVQETRKRNWYNNFHVFVKAMCELAEIREREAANQRWRSTRT